MKKVIATILSIALFIIVIAPNVYASETTLIIDKVFCSPKSTVNVPIMISGNTGIAGAVIKISYDKSLELLSVNTGEAFNSLTFTPPAKLTSNPITLLWDGMEADSSNGTIAILQFRVPDSTGAYNISASYDVGGIYDGDTNDINVLIENGSIIVSNEPIISATITDTIDVELFSNEAIEGNVYVALYDSRYNLIEAKVCTAEKSLSTKLKNIDKGVYIKVFWWEASTLKPYCKAVTIEL